MRTDKRSLGFTAVALQALFLTSACRDGPTDPDDLLTDAEVVEVAKNMSTMLFSGLADPEIFETTVVSPCPGGTVSIEIGEPEIDDEEGLLFLFTYEANPQGCSVPLEGGANIVIHGNPGIGGDARMTITEFPGPFSIRVNIAGGLRYTTSDARNGICDVDVRHRLAGTLDFEQGFSGTETLRGTICGVEIDYSGTA